MYMHAYGMMYIPIVDLSWVSKEYFCTICDVTWAYSPYYMHFKLHHEGIMYDGMMNHNIMTV